MTGWISLHRSIEDHWIFKEKRTFSKFEAWIYILMETNHTEGKTPIGNQIVTVKRGENLTSKLKLSEKFNWSRKKLDNFLSALEEEEMIHIKCTTKYTVITVVNYDYYQSEKGRNAHQKNIKRTSMEHQQNINGTSTEHQRHTNNNVNNELITINNVDNANKPSSNIENETSEVFAFYQNNGFGMINSYIGQQLKNDINKYGAQLVIRALQETTINNVYNYKYTQKILSNWHSKNIDTVEKVDAFLNSKSNTYNAGNTVKIVEEEQSDESWRDQLDDLFN